MDIVTRREAGLRPAEKLILTTWSRRDEVVFHYTGGPESQSWRSIQDWCMDGKGHSDIDYNGGIDMSDGRLFEGREGIWLSVGSHNLNRNTRGIGFAFIGTAGTPLSDAAKRTARWCVAEARRRKAAAGAGGGLAVGVHSDYRETSCPGSIVRAWVKSGMPAPAGGGEELGVYGTVVKGTNGHAARWVQQRCKEIDSDALPRYGVDDEYGEETASEVRRLFGGDGAVFGPDQFKMWQTRREALMVERILAQVPAAQLPERVAITGEINLSA